MKDLTALNGNRIPHPRTGDLGDETCGAFIVKGPNNQPLNVIASAFMGWDHVSVSLKNRCPNWLEMSFIKNLFFKKEETVMQLHVRGEDHINIHENCLHLWRPYNGEIPLPPKNFV